MPQQREHHLVVASELRDPPNLRALSRAVLALAKNPNTRDREPNPGTAASRSKAAATPQPAQKKTRPRLSSETTDELATAYQHGATAAELAHQYDISKTTVLNMFTKRGITRRHQPLTSVDIDHLERLYLVGHSLTACSRLTRIPASTIKDVLHKRATPMRPAGGTRTNPT
ncbi:hypothetical protein ACFYU5_08715 [Nocardia aobensis]|uniref:HTH psq-type domain-containing protein n=1 Tax=Nocardia aobensis TaxID=257277 RepID=A0ABW6P242_9NOCA